MSAPTQLEQTPVIVPVDDAHADMMAYGRGGEGRAKIAHAEAEIDAGRGIVADNAYFDALKARRQARSPR